MIFKELTLTDFRNFPTYTLHLNDKLTVIEGPNSVGKTNLLEALYLMMSAKGIKEEKQEELIRFGQSSTTLAGVLYDPATKRDTQAHMVTVLGDTVDRKYAINRSTKSQFEFIKQMPPAILFTPQRIEFLTQSPARRRKLLDTILSRIDPDYKRALTNYSTGLIKRNKLLERGQVPTLDEELAFWDTFLIEHGGSIQEKRASYVGQLNKYQPFSNFPLTLVYLPNKMTRERLKTSLPLQLRYRNTLIGAQRDDYDVVYAGDEGTPISVLRFGSRSQQRLALLWVNLHELLLHAKRGARPVLLLDDIFSELDEANKEVVLATIQDFQTVMTTNDASLVTHYYPEFSIVQLQK